jgi:hypothetical protein
VTATRVVITKEEEVVAAAGEVVGEVEEVVQAARRHRHHHRPAGGELEEIREVMETAVVGMIQDLLHPVQVCRVRCLESSLLTQSTPSRRH